MIIIPIRRDCITSVQRYIRPTILWTYAQVVFSSSWSDMNYMSDTHSIEKIIVYLTYCWSVAQLFVSWLHTSVGRMHIFCKQDAQLLYVGCTTFVGGIHNFCRSDAQFVQVGCTHFVGRMHNFCMSDKKLLQVSAQLLQVGCAILYVGCTHFVGEMHTFCRSDARLISTVFGPEIVLYLT